VQELINDLNFQELEEDLIEFRSFLNESFYADDFYCQSLLTYAYQVLDDLAIKDHIQTIPKIFKEMWEVLGESSTAFKNSLSSIVATVRANFRKLNRKSNSSQVQANFFKGESYWKFT
jgi:hypothetical protein